jgi:hypothetical protein
LDVEARVALVDVGTLAGAALAVGAAAVFEAVVGAALF